MNLFAVEAADTSHAKAAGHGQLAGINHVTLLFEPVVKALEIELGVGHLCPTAKRPTVAHLLGGPATGLGLELRVVWKHVAEVGGIVTAVVFDHGRSLDHRDQFGRDLRGVESLPVNIV